MTRTSERTAYGLYLCMICRDDPAEECGDACSFPWPDEMPLSLVSEDYFPTCRCCGSQASLVTPLVAVA